MCGGGGGGGGGESRRGDGCNLRHGKTRLGSRGDAGLS